MDRRTLLKTGGLALAGFGLTGCGQSLRAGTSSAPRRPPVNLAPVNVSWDRVIRTTVGLRPHRDSGFVLRAEKLDAKTLIHDYGHGGTGMSLGWGCGSLVADVGIATGRASGVARHEQLDDNRRRTRRHVAGDRPYPSR